MENKCQALSTFSRNWANMNYDILVKIFAMVSTMDLISNISRVCPLWRAACFHPSFWHTLDLASLKCDADYPHDECAPLENHPSLRLMQTLTSALILSGNNVTLLIFHFQACISDSHFIFAAERCPRVKQLVLPAWSQISVNGFCEAIRKLTELESLTLPCDYFPHRLLQTIGVNCMKLSELKIMCPFDHDFANTMFIYLPKLKFLSLRCSIVYKDALRLTLMLFDDLKVLNLSHSLLVSLFPSEIPTIFSCERHTSLAEQASRIKTLLWCQKDSCAMCQRVLNNAGHPNWHEYEEELWREDEVCFISTIIIETQHNRTQAASYFISKARTPIPQAPAYFPSLFCYHFSSSTTMKISIPSSRISFQLLLIIILAVTQLSTCRHLHRNIGGDDQTKKPAKTVLSPQFSWHFPATAPAASARNQIDPVYGVSFRQVPGGPNPLHN